jgi:hypothetical protein
MGRVDTSAYRRVLEHFSDRAPAELPEHARESGDAMSTTALRTIRHRIAREETSGGSTRTAPAWDPAAHPQEARDPAHHRGHLHFPTAV